MTLHIKKSSHKTMLFVLLLNTSKYLQFFLIVLMEFQTKSYHYIVFNHKCDKWENFLLSSDLNYTEI